MSGQSWLRRRFSSSREFGETCGNIRSEDVDRLIELSFFLHFYLEFDEGKMYASRLPLLLLSRELWRRKGVSERWGSIGGDGWLEFCSAISMSLAFGHGTLQDLPLAAKLLVDGYSKSKSECSFPFQLIRIGVTSYQVVGKLSNEKLDAIDHEEDSWIEDDGCPGEEFPLFWQKNLPEADEGRMRRFLNDNGEVNEYLKSVGGLENFLNWDSFLQELRVYASDQTFHFFPESWVDAITNDDVSVIMKAVGNPAFGNKGLVSLFWCRASHSIAELVRLGRIGLSPEKILELAARNLPDGIEVLKAIERKWPGLIRGYRDARGQSLLQKMDRELVFGAWRWFLGDDAMKTKSRLLIEGL